MYTSRDPSPQRVRQAALFLTAGGAISVAILAVSRASDGYLAAGAFLVAITVAAISVGVAAEFVAGFISRDLASRQSSGMIRCGSCTRHKIQLGSIYVCSICDGIRA
jgi:hypothetical protein